MRHENRKNPFANTAGISPISLIGALMGHQAKAILKYTSKRKERETAGVSID
jgi:hypothetical protein